MKRTQAVRASHCTSSTISLRRTAKIQAQKSFFQFPLLLSSPKSQKKLFCARISVTRRGERRGPRGEERETHRFFQWSVDEVRASCERETLHFFDHFPSTNGRYSKHKKIFSDSCLSPSPKSQKNFFAPGFRPFVEEERPKKCNVSLSTIAICSSMNH